MRVNDPPCLQNGRGKQKITEAWRNLGGEVALTQPTLVVCYFGFAVNSRVASDKRHSPDHRRPKPFRPPLPPPTPSRVRDPPPLLLPPSSRFEITETRRCIIAPW